MTLSITQKGVAALALAVAAATVTPTAANAATPPSAAVTDPFAAAVRTAASAVGVAAAASRLSAGTAPALPTENVSRPAVVDLLKRAKAADDSSYVTQLVEILKLIDDGARKAIPPQLRQALLIAALKYGGPALAELIKGIPVVIQLSGVDVSQDVVKQITDPIAGYVKTESAALSDFLIKQPKGKWDTDTIAAFLHDERGVPQTAALPIAVVFTVLGN